MLPKTSVHLFEDFSKEVFEEYLGWVRSGRKTPLNPNLESVHSHLTECAECRLWFFRQLADPFDDINYTRDMSYLLEIAASFEPSQWPEADAGEGRDSDSPCFGPALFE